MRVLVVARHPLRIGDLGLDGDQHVDVVGLVRRLGSVSQLIEQAEPDVVIVDTAFADGGGFRVMADIVESTPDIAVLALTPDPPPHEQVARAMGAGALGFIDVDLEPGECSEAVRSVYEGEPWLPTAQTQAVLQSVADDYTVTKAEHRSRLTAVALGAIPLAGVMAAVLSLLWRKYLGQIGVRPVDLAIDPGTRVVDMVLSLLFIIGIVGPFLLIPSWIERLSARSDQNRVARWVTARPRLAFVVLFIVVLVAVALLATYVDLVLALFVGPMMVVAITAAFLGVEDELPPILRHTTFSLRRFLVTTLSLVFALLLVLGSEAFVRGPGFGPDGVNGVLMHRLVGFRAQPVLVIDVDGEREPRELLYLGGNADLYVLVDPCSGDQVEFVSVGSSRLENIDTVTCASPAD